MHQQETIDTTVPSPHGGHSQVSTLRTFAKHLKQLSGKCFYHLRQLRTVRRSITVDAAKTLVHAFVMSRVDYCNSVLSGVAAIHLRVLQSVLNAAARLVMQKMKYDHISCILQNELHWLPIKQRIEFKTCVLINKCLHSAAPLYLIDMCRHVSTEPGRRHLRSAVHGDLIVPRTRTVTYCPRSFMVAGPTSWNKLPVTIRHPSHSVDQLCSYLKTQIYRGAGFEAIS